MTASSAPIDRWNARRDEDGLLDSLRTDPRTRVMVVHDRAARVEDDALVLNPVDEVTMDADWALLGGGEDGAVLLASVAQRPEGGVWEGVRDAAPRLSARDADLLLAGVALSVWHRGAPFCPRCGTRTELRSAGWMRACPGCSAQHFPRTDPAVIVAIASPDGERLLLGANALWEGRMYSCFAGFVEAGESMETTVHREIEEEAGVLLSEVRFFGSQPWPFPHSLMVGFHATAADEASARADGEEIIDVRWFTREEIGSALAGRGPVALPGPASIARRLIEAWHGA